MVYASIQEAWGNSFVIENQNKISSNIEESRYRLDSPSTANFEGSRRTLEPHSMSNGVANFRDSRRTLEPHSIGRTTPNFETFHKDFLLSKNKNKNYKEDRLKYNNSIEVGNPKKSTYRFPRENYDMELDISEISDPISDVSSVDNIFELKKLRGKTINMNIKPKSQNINKKDDDKHLEHFVANENCVSIFEHVKNCENCRNLIENDNKNIFMKEFIIFASSGVLMFVLLELLAKILKK